MTHTRFSAAAVLAATLAAGVPVARGEVHEIPLEANFNGIFHAGEEVGAPDGVNGFRSISDRGLNFSGGVPTGLSTTGLAGSMLTYAPVADAFTLDIVHLGNRNTVDNGNHAFDVTPDGDNVGVQPAWLESTDQTGPQTTMLPTPLTLNAAAQVGVLYQASNGGSSFDVTLHFADATSVTVTVNAPDWYQANSPALPGPGVAWQESLGTFPGTESVDVANPGPALNVAEAVITAEQVDANLGFDLSGRTLTAVTFQNSACLADPCGVAVIALSVEDGQGLAEPCAVDLDDSGAVDVFDLLAYLDGWFAGCP
jgi:hypothetical protein